ncbi:hypothetical protein ZYGR_0A03800 [Zygosaccharomyces rouxii]|uniref:ZYRO0A08602p n=2 Tax=Zygosaccharomyces rouxii TaxID=4956 RepID=C5DQ48_ZYGRC|nr:uncharacterized protein ZYRO0A08602g [Zygosaccharomyces rouxii]KAH9198671.1 hypothetical protein LQ764DRAFT_226147 [Zygosaccharomyces rouxii]GAV46784.1 hypothetical protein ZYGR_0A03800 [Zygosaccharomyces rouxii]CAR25809.1 ZYRO0A08602p [Zygosaccharomyces rouxii]
MKFILPLAVVAPIAEAHLIQRDNIDPSSRSSVNTVYTFIGSGSSSNVLQMQSSSSSPSETSDSARESSALSQLLHASTVSAPQSTEFSSASVTSSPSNMSASGSSDASSKKHTGTNTGDKPSSSPSSSSTKSAASSGAANHLDVPIMAGGIAVAAIAML